MSSTEPTSPATDERARLAEQRQRLALAAQSADAEDSAQASALLDAVEARLGALDRLDERARLADAEQQRLDQQAAARQRLEERAQRIGARTDRDRDLRHALRAVEASTAELAALVSTALDAARGCDAAAAALAALDDPPRLSLAPPQVAQVALSLAEYVLPCLRSAGLHDTVPFGGRPRAQLVTPEEEAIP